MAECRCFGRIWTSRFRFSSLDLTDVNRTSTPKYGNGLRGKSPDGTPVSIRRGSTTGPATMDIGLKDGRYIGTKIRYGE